MTTGPFEVSKFTRKVSGAFSFGSFCAPAEQAPRAKARVANKGIGKSLRFIEIILSQAANPGTKQEKKWRKQCERHRSPMRVDHLRSWSGRYPSPERER